MLVIFFTPFKMEEKVTNFEIQYFELKSLLICRKTH